VPSIFFEEQLTAFEVWLSHGCQERSPPEQLPIVLQVSLLLLHFEGAVCSKLKFSPVTSHLARQSLSHFFGTLIQIFSLMRLKSRYFGLFV
jgi:hypothetical protein